MGLDVCRMWRKDIDDVLKTFAFAAGIFHVSIIGSFADDVNRVKNEPVLHARQRICGPGEREGRGQSAPRKIWDSKKKCPDYAGHLKNLA